MLNSAKGPRGPVNFAKEAGVKHNGQNNCRAEDSLNPKALIRHGKQEETCCYDLGSYYQFQHRENEM